MAQAAKLFDQHDAQGNVQSGNKQQAIQSAASMAMKLLSSSGAASGGNAGSGGLGIAGLLMGAGTNQGGGAAQLMSLASKLM